MKELVEQRSQDPSDKRRGWQKNRNLNHLLGFDKGGATAGKSCSLSLLRQWVVKRHPSWLYTMYSRRAKLWTLYWRLQQFSMSGVETLLSIELSPQEEAT